jgi:YD repeat-containing protein
MWDELSDNVAAEYEDGVLSVAYTHEPGLYGDLLSQNRNGVTSYYHYDGRGDTVALTDDAGNVTDTKEYDAWGNVISSTGSTATPYQFLGRSGYQTGIGAVFSRGRTYYPSVGRFGDLMSMVYVFTPLTVLQASRVLSADGLEITLDAAACPGCTESWVRWHFLPSAKLRSNPDKSERILAVFQIICEYAEVHYCKDEYLGSGCCSYIETKRTGCCFLEFLNGIVNQGVQSLPAHDEWGGSNGTPMIPRKFGCSSVGERITSAEIRAFRNGSQLMLDVTDAAMARTDGWEPMGDLQCGDETLTVGMHIDLSKHSVPKWWDDGKRIAGRGTTLYHQQWLCCPGDNFSSSMIVSASGDPGVTSREICPFNWVDSKRM